ncbi:methyltransferase [Luteolibacter sp. AS25]|uniref:methyltransferase n=1 Tax=Luteolibacter sp. AS25 TaxID=3135776 RepID=UPI00398B5BC8
MPYHLREHLFPTGELLISDSVTTKGIKYLPFLRRHLSGDWGDVDQYTSDSNHQSLKEGNEILSQYSLQDIGITEDLLTIVSASDREYTVVFFPNDPC